VLQLPLSHQNCSNLLAIVRLLGSLKYHVIWRGLLASLHICMQSSSYNHFWTSTSTSAPHTVYTDVLQLEPKERSKITLMTPCALGVWFHHLLWSKISLKKSSGDNRALPRRHQPHNGVMPTDKIIGTSITNLLHLVDELRSLNVQELQKHYYHSKAIGILMMRRVGVMPAEV
jgi:hypothetical protein